MEEIEYIECSQTTKEVLEKYDRRQQSNKKNQIVKKPMGRMIDDNYSDSIPLHCYYRNGRLITVYKSKEGKIYCNAVLKVR